MSKKSWLTLYSNVSRKNVLRCSNVCPTLIPDEAPTHWNAVETYRKGTNWLKSIPFNSVYLRMWGFLETICFDCLIVLLEIKPTGITLTTDCSCSGEGVCRMIPNGSPVSQVQHLDACLPPTSSSLTVCVTILVLVYFFESQSKESMWKKKTQVLVGLSTSSRHIYFLWLSSLNILKYLDHLLLQKMKYFLQSNRF